jgi:anthranilate phosphoribosyltransferase
VVALNAAAGLVSYQLAKNPQLAEVPIRERLLENLKVTQAALANNSAGQKLSQWSAATQQF